MAATAIGVGSKQSRTGISYILPVIVLARGLYSLPHSVALFMFFPFLLTPLGVKP
jgi:hypothetical protein